MKPRVLGSVLATTSAGFAVVHAMWALGWRGGIPADVAPIAERPVFLAYDVAAGTLMALAAVVAVLLARGGMPRRATERLVALTVVGSVLALLRGAPALALDVVGGDWSGVGPLADAWFVGSGLLGLALAAAVWARSRLDVDPRGAVRPRQPAAG